MDKLFSVTKAPSKLTELDPFLIFPRQNYSSIFYTEQEEDKDYLKPSP
jgi:hypothetical protein